MESSEHKESSSESKGLSESEGEVREGEVGEGEVGEGEVGEGEVGEGEVGESGQRLY